MFYMNRAEELTPELLHKMQARFIAQELPKLEKAANYYEGAQAITGKSYTDPTKPCSRSVTNFCKNIADTYRGYAASAGYITYHSAEDITAIMDVLKKNDYQTQDSEFMLNALKFGRAAELCYIDEAAEVRFKQIDPRACFGIYDDSLSGELLYFVRFYPVNDWDDIDNWALDVYTAQTIRHYTMDGKQGGLQFVDDEPHYFSKCPANLFSLEDGAPIYACIYGLQDAYNELYNSELDDYSAFCDAYMTLTGVDADPEEIAKMKESRVLLLPDGAGAGWLTKNANDAQVENILTRTQADIYRIAQCPDLSAESFVGGVSSGVAIKYRLTGIETRAAGIVASMRKALQRRVEIIAGFASMKNGEAVALDVRIDFARNIPEDMSATVQTVAQLQGIVSEKTLLSLLPFVSDVDAEQQAVEEQKRANFSAYNFGGLE